MKRIEIHTKSEHMRPVLDALEAVGVGGLTVASVRGRGKKNTPVIRGLRGSAKFVADFNSRILIYTIVDDEMIEKVIKEILDSVQHQDSDAFGKMFITNIEDAIDLATGTRGVQAL